MGGSSADPTGSFVRRRNLDARRDRDGRTHRGKTMDLQAKERGLRETKSANTFHCSWTSSSRNCEKINFHSLNPPACADPLTTAGSMTCSGISGPSAWLVLKVGGRSDKFSCRTVIIPVRSLVEIKTAHVS